MVYRVYVVVITLGLLVFGARMWQLSAQTPPPPDSMACQSEVSKAYTQLVTTKLMQPNAAALGWSVQLTTITDELEYSATQLEWARNAERQWQRDAARLLKDNNALRRTNAELQQAQQGAPAAPPAPPAN